MNINANSNYFLWFPCSKIFQKKIEKLFDPHRVDRDSPETAATLFRLANVITFYTMQILCFSMYIYVFPNSFRCSICRKILTRNLRDKVNCLQSRLDSATCLRCLFNIQNVHVLNITANHFFFQQTECRPRRPHRLRACSGQAVGR